jgi:hypothetical protein
MGLQDEVLVVLENYPLNLDTVLVDPLEVFGVTSGQAGRCQMQRARSPASTPGCTKKSPT